MSRAKKFRAWDKSRKKMLYTNFHDRGWYYTPYNDEEGCHWAFDKKQSDHAFLEIMDETGVTDKNETEIYEADIIKIDNDGEIYITHVRSEMGTLAVDAINQDYSYTAIGWLDDWCIFEVIGNIYQNPELLEIKNV